MCFPDGMQNSDHVVHWPQLQPLSQTCWPHILCKGRNIIPTSILEHPEVATEGVYIICLANPIISLRLEFPTTQPVTNFPTETSSTHPSSVAMLPPCQG